jgi:hypothetical protein
MLNKGLYDGKEWWAKEDSECAKLLRTIAMVLEEWRPGQELLSDATPEQEFLSRLHHDRYILGTIAWLLMGKTLDEIQQMHETVRRRPNAAGDVEE